MPTEYSTLGLFSGAGGLDLGFERAGFRHTSSLEILPTAAQTLRDNRPGWQILEGDVRDWTAEAGSEVDVLLAGFPCQGISLGGKRDRFDVRNLLYREVVRIAQELRPRVVVMENVLNLRTMRAPDTDRPFADQICHELAAIGYAATHRIFRMSDHGVPQTRRRFVFVAFRDAVPLEFRWPAPTEPATVRDSLHALAVDDSLVLPNHAPAWSFPSRVHSATHAPVPDPQVVVPVRFSRTASDGHPVRSWDAPFPAVDTATVWGFARGPVSAERFAVDRAAGQFIRNRASDVRLWRITASQLRAMTAREYARLQTFPDDWIFAGSTKRDVQLQIGNAVPVEFARRIGQSVRETLEAVDDRRAVSSPVRAAA